MIAFALAAALAQAAGPPAPPALSIGSKAPVPEVTAWVRGEAPEFWKPGTVYVVAFWASWSGPSRQSLAPLSKLEDDLRARGVVVVGVTDEPPEEVRRFTGREEWRGKARFALGADPDGSMRREWLDAALQRGLPTAFVVKEGVVQWIGHPRDAEATLAKVLDGSWDLAAAKVLHEAIVAEDARARERERMVTEAMAAKDVDRALAALDGAIAEAGADAAMPLRVQRALLLLGADRAEEGYAAAEGLAAQDPGVRAWLASGILRMPMRDRRVEVALRWLEGATPAGQQPSPQVLAEIGYAWELKGDRSKAAEFTRRALEGAKALGPAGEDWAADLREVLRGYEQAPTEGK